MIDIFLPVLGRPEQIPVVISSIQTSTLNEHNIICVCSPGDDEATEVARDHADTTIVTNWEAGKADYAKKLALAFEHSEGEWFFQGATDLAFHAGWDSAALLIARRFRRRVIGTNDLGNPMVKRGLHSTHSLVARSYIEERGGTTDGSGLIFSEDYDHQWSDCEFIDTARLRKEYAHAKHSIVEHLHPHWGKGEQDDTYRKAHRETRKDQETYRRRRNIFVRGAGRR